jgi:hypothetical protein
MALFKKKSEYLSETEQTQTAKTVETVKKKRGRPAGRPNKNKNIYKSKVKKHKAEQKAKEKEEIKPGAEDKTVYITELNKTVITDMSVETALKKTENTEIPEIKAEAPPEIKKDTAAPEQQIEDNLKKLQEEEKKKVEEQEEEIKKQREIIKNTPPEERKKLYPLITGEILFTGIDTVMKILGKRFFHKDPKDITLNDIEKALQLQSCTSVCDYYDLRLNPIAGLILTTLYCYKDKILPGK